MTPPWFAGLPPIQMLHVMRDKADVWGAWLCLTAAEAHKLMMLIDVEALRLDMEVHLFASETFISGPGMETPAWSVCAKSVTGAWHAVL